ncbi:MAG: aldose 1-epimerase [Verrucomicrobiales bacterium]|jgi:aldose 1-epimerase
MRIQISWTILTIALGLTTVNAQKVESTIWGQTPEGEDVQLFTLTNANGLTARVMSLGATLVGVDAPDRDGNFENVTLHFDDLETFLTERKVFGSTIGRFGNRISGGGFEIDGTRYDLETVNQRNGVHIHGGKTGFQWQNWEAKALKSGVLFSLTSEDGHEGYPGRLTVNLTFTLTDDNELVLSYSATTDKPTHVNLTNHAYWNLGGADSGDVLDQQLLVSAEQRLAVDEHQVPTGELVDVANTAFDFREVHTMGERIADADRGYDHCYVIEGESGKLRLAARVTDPKSGRIMEVRTTEPGIQVYTMNIGEKTIEGGGGATYAARHAVCLECQKFPDAPNQPDFESTLLRPGEIYRQVTAHKFSIAETKPED